MPYNIKTDPRRAVHKRSVRFYNNAGINFPECRSGDCMLNMDCSSWNITTVDSEVTCKNCLREMAR
jgi:hypothetical protein